MPLLAIPLLEIAIAAFVSTIAARVAHDIYNKVTREANWSPVR